MYFVFSPCFVLEHVEKCVLSRAMIDNRWVQQRLLSQNQVNRYITFNGQVFVVKRVFVAFCPAHHEMEYSINLMMSMVVISPIKDGVDIAALCHVEWLL